MVAVCRGGGGKNGWVKVRGEKSGRVGLGQLVLWPMLCGSGQSFSMRSPIRPGDAGLTPLKNGCQIDLILNVI